MSVVKVPGDKIEVEIGSIIRPMKEAHYISFVYVETEHGGQRKCLKVGETSKAIFTFIDDRLNNACSCLTARERHFCFVFFERSEKGKNVIFYSCVNMT